MSEYILGIESSCDDTSAAVLSGTAIRSNVIASQSVHNSFGGVVPELASRAHQQNIIPVVDTALSRAGITKDQLSAIAFTRGPGLLGSLLVGTSFAKSLSYALGIPLIDINHMEAHVLAHLITDPNNPKPVPSFPFLCLTVSGGHTQIVRMDDYHKMTIIGRTIDDAAGEAFDKAAKILGLPYPGGPLVDKNAKDGNPEAFRFSKPNIPDLDYSFSGLKTSFLYTVRDHLREDPQFIEKSLADLCASIQKAIIDTLMKKLELAVKQTGIKDVAIAGGVSANSGLRNAMLQKKNDGWNVFIPEFQFTTDNAAMIAVAGYFKYLKKEYADLSLPPYSRGNGQ
jgi:N6-L-threonylcarbamoyladenine synthase